MRTNMNWKDVKAQALWEMEIEDFEKAVAREKIKLMEKRAWFPWRLKLINLNKGVKNGN